MPISSRGFRNVSKINSSVEESSHELRLFGGESGIELDFNLRGTDSAGPDGAVVGNLTPGLAGDTASGGDALPAVAQQGTPSPLFATLTSTSGNPGAIAIIGYGSATNVTAPATEDKLYFVALDTIAAGTVIHFTDRSWNGTAFTNAAGDGTFTYTAPGGGVAAGTVITISQADLTAAGIDLNHTTGDTFYVYLGAANAPTQFLYAAEFADGNTTFNGSLVNTGLTAGYTAVAVGTDSGAYTGPTTHAESFMWNGAGSSLLHSIADANNWVGDDAVGDNAKEQEVQTGPWLVHGDVEFWGTMSGGGGGLANTMRDPTFASGNDDFNHTRQYDGSASFFSLRDIVFDTVDGKFFLVDSDITGGHNRILQGNISDLLGSPGTTPTLTVLYSDSGTTTDARLDNLEVDVANNIIYFTHGSELIKIGYDTANQAGTLLFDANAQGAISATTGNPAGSTNNFFNDMVIDFGDGRIYISSTRVLAGASGDVVSKNFIYELTGLTTSSGVNAFTMAGTNNNGTARLLPFVENDLAYNPFPGTVAAASPFSNTQDPYAWALERGTLDGLAIDPVNNILYFSTGEILFDHDGNSGTAAQYAGGVIASYNLTGNPTGIATILYQQTAQFGGAIPGLMGDLEVDLVNGHLYVLDYNGVNGVNDDNHWFRMNTTASTPIQFTQTVGDVQGAATVGLTLNHAPTLSGNGLAAAVTEQSNAPNSAETTRPLLFNSITIADVDTSTADEITGAVIRISNNFQSGATHQDFLRIAGNTSGTIAGSGIAYTYNQATGAMVLTGPGTVAEYKAAIELVTFSTSGDDPTAYGSATTRTISVSVSDGLTMSDEVSNTVTVTGINDAPVNTPGAAMNFTEDTTGNVGAEGTPPTPVSNAVTGISVFDVDANPATQDITVTLSVGVGTLTIRTDVVGGIQPSDVISGNGTGTIVITATQNQINTTLAALSPAFTGPPAQAAAPNGLIYTPPANYNGATNLTITTNDNGFNGNDPGLTGTGTSEQDQDVKVINLADVNDAPTVGGDGTEAAADILEDTPFTNANAPTVATLFGGQFSDAIDVQVSGGNPTGSPGDTFAGIAIVADGSSGATGQWEYWNGASWVDIGAASQAAARTFSANTQIRFSPVLNYNGPAPTLTVHLIESGGPAITNNGTVNLSPVGTATGGTTVYSTGTVVLSQNIVAVNDAPVNTVGGTLTVAEDSGATNVTGMSISDVDANPATDVFTVTLDVLHGTLTMSGAVAGGVPAGNISGSGTATITLTGTINQINTTLAAAGGLTYTPTGDYNGSDRVQITTNDGGATGQDPGLTGTATSEQDQDSKTISVTAVNDPVTGTAPASATMDEDATNVAIAGMSISDIDATLAPAGVYEVTLTATNGTMTLTTITGLTFSTGNGTANATMTFHGTLADINAALATATYTPTPNYAGSATITLNVTDTFGGIVATGTGAATNDSDVVNVTVNAINDTPVNNVPVAAQNVNEDNTLTFNSGNSNLISVTDVDSASGDVTVTVTVLHGTLSLGGNAGLSGETGDGTASITISGPLAAINNALNGLSYTPNQHYNGPDTLTITTNDNGNTGTDPGLTGGANDEQDQDVININVVAQNDTPVVAVAASVSSTEQVAGTIDATATITDVELGALNGGSGDYGGSTLTIGRNGGAQAEDLIEFGPSGGAFTVNGANLEAPGGLVFATFVGGNGANLVITFTSSGTPATQALVNAVVQSLQYTYTGDNPPASIMMDYTLDDGAPTNASQGGGGSPTGTDSIQINITDTPENIAPVLDLNGADPGDGSTAAVTEQSGPGTLAPALTITDVDDTDLVGATIVISGPVSGDLLSVAGVPNGTSGTISWVWNGTDTLTFTGTASLADYQALLRTVTFEANGDDPGTSRTISWTVNDGIDNSNQPTTVVTVTPQNDAPTLTGTGATPTFTEGGAAVDLFSGVSASTVEAGQTITSMTLTVTNVTESNSEVLTIDGSDVALGNGNVVVTSGNGLTVNVSVAGNVATVSFTGATLSAAALAAIVDAITYRNLSDNPTDADRVITITQVVDSGPDGGGDVNNSNPSLSATVNVDPVNDPASITGDATGDVTEAGGANNGTAGTQTDSGDLDATDLDNFPDDTWQAVAPGGTTTNGYGTYALSASGVWTYTLDDNNAAVQALNGAATLTDTFTALTADGTAQVVTVTIHAQNDDAVITGDIAGDVTEAGGIANGSAGTPTDIGDLNAADVDNTADAWQAASAGSATVNGYGTYELTAAGVWTYTLDNSNAAVQALNGAATLTDSFTALTEDGTAQVVTVTIHAQNDYPTIANMDGDSVNYVENATPVALDLGGDALVGDVDSPDFDGGTLQVNISSNYNAAQDVLGITTSATITLSNGINVGSIVSVGATAIGTISAGSPGSQSFTITLNGSANAANVTTLVHALNYSNSSDNPTTLGGRTIQVSLTDGDGSPATTVSTLVTLTRINDEPTSSNVTINGVSEDDPYTFQTTDFPFSDVDGHSPFTVRFTSLPTDGDILLNGVAIMVNDEIAYSAIAAGMLTFQPDPDEFGTPYTSFTFQVRDNGGVVNPGDDDLSATYTATINVDPDNLPPVVDLNGGAAGIDASVSYTEDAPGIAIDTGIVITDPIVAGDMVESATITLTDRVVGDVLAIAGALPAGISSSIVINAGNIVVTLTGTASQADYATAIGQIRYSTTNQDPTVGGTDAQRTITVVVNDGQFDSAVATSTVTITPVDDAPTAQPDTFTIDEDDVLTGNLFDPNPLSPDTDPDGPALTISAVNGDSGNVGMTITLASGAELTVNADGSFTYDTNHAFDPTPTPGSGASNQPVPDSFTYTLTGGNTVTVSLTINGLDTDDLLLGTTGSDFLIAGVGADTLVGLGGNDAMDGGTGIDTATFSGALSFADTAVNWIVTSIEGNDVLQNIEIVVEGNGQRSLLVGAAGFATLQAALNAAVADDDIRLAAGTYSGTFNYSDTGLAVIAQSGALINATFTPSGSEGITVLAAGGADHVTTGAGNDLIDGGAGVDTLTGGAGDDQYFVDAGDIVVETAGGGFDIVYAGTSYTLSAGAVVEVLGTVNNLAATAINLTGNELANYVTGNAGANILDGGSSGADVLWGREGDDSYFVDSDDDVVEYTGQGYDIVYARSSFTLLAGDDVEVLGTVDNTATTAINLTGNELSNYVTGNAGDNVIDGGAGSDFLHGRGGSDSFAFTTALGATNVDEIFDFVSGTDKIALDDAIFAGIGTPGSFDANAFVAGSAALDANDRIIYNQATGQLFYDADGNGAGAAVLFGLLSGLPSLAASDFTVI